MDTKLVPEASSSPPAGQRLLPNVVDDIAATDPSRVFFSVTKTKDPADGFQDVNAKQFARAVDRCAWHLEQALGIQPNFRTLAYMGPQDLIYAVLSLACVKTGYKLLLLSLRNTLEAHVSLLEQTECNFLLFPTNFSLPILRQIIQARPMQVVVIPGASHWLEDGYHNPYHYGRSFAEAAYDPIMVLQTSGSTGLPKPIVQRHATFATVDAYTTVPSLGMPPVFPATCAGKRVYITLPLFHSAGISMLLYASVYIGFTAVLGPFPPSPDLVNAVHLYGNVQHSVVAPMILNDLAKVPEYLENLSRLEQVTFGGGPCPQAVGDLVASKTRLLNVVGSTECAMLPIQQSEPQDWAYLNASPLAGHEYRHVSGNLYEQVIVKSPARVAFQGIFGTFPELNEWRMKDLYSKHRSKENLWLYQGRTDDLIVLTAGEKLSPIAMEGIISADAAVAGALVLGGGRNQTSLLVEAAGDAPTTDTEKADFAGRIWPSVQLANKIAPSHGRIHQDMILFTTPSKPMLRAGKGTIQRRMTVDLYAAEIDDLYQAAEERAAGSETPKHTNGDVKKTVSLDSIKAILSTSTDISVDELSPHTDLFEQGLDSLQVSLVTKEINKLLVAHGRPPVCNPRVVYANPTITALFAAVHDIIEGRQALEIDSDASLNMMRDMYVAHASDLPLSSRQALPRPTNNKVVLMTGSTGSLGSYILDALIRNPSVTRIYCLSRGHNTRIRQNKSQLSKGLQPLPAKVECLDANLAEPYFGLPRQDYKMLLAQVTNVIHNAWQVDFNLSISSFAGHVMAVRKFIDFSVQSTFNAELLFVSSISAVGGLAGNISEQSYQGWHTPLTSGYGQSKFVAERLLDTAARVCNVSAAICRLGQIAGPVCSGAGMWPKQEWLPSLIASSKHLGMLPDTLGRLEVIDWIPVDLLGGILCEIMLSSSENAPTNSVAVYHMVNPQQTSWKRLVSTISRCLRVNLQIVPLQTWLDALRESQGHATYLAKNPAVKLLDFMADLAKKECRTALVTENTVRASATLAGLEAVREEWMVSWMRQWAF